MELLVDKIQSEIGTIVIVSDGKALCALDFADYEPRMLKLLQKRYATVSLRPQRDPSGISSRIQAYLAGEWHSLDQIPVNPGGTAFQQQVWRSLRSIPPGSVWSYGELAATISRPTASRAVGMANSLNPVAIVLPCHRVVGANARLTGYAGGLARKQWLLQHEGVDLKQFVDRSPPAIGTLFTTRPDPLPSHPTVSRG